MAAEPSITIYGLVISVEAGPAYTTAGTSYSRIGISPTPNAFVAGGTSETPGPNEKLNDPVILDLWVPNTNPSTTLPWAVGDAVSIVITDLGATGQPL